MDSKVRETLGIRVRVEWVKRRLKQSDLAASVGVTQSDVSQLELDKKVVPARRNRILRALGIEENTSVQ
jgi:predicted XRE-type DNA-binding protein